MYGSGRKHSKLSISGHGHSAFDPNSSSYQKTVITYNTRNTSDETIIWDATGIERTDEISVSYYEPFGMEV